MSLTWIPQHTPLSCTSPVGKFTCIIQSALVPTIQWNSRTLHLEVVLWIYLLGFHPWACTWWKLSHFQLLLRWSDTRYWYAWSKHETCCPWIMWSYPDCHTLAWLAYQICWFLLQTCANTLPPLWCASVQYTLLQYSTGQQHIVFSSSKWWLKHPHGRNIQRLSACVAVQPNLCHKSLWELFFHTHWMLARGVWLFLGKQSLFLHLPSEPDPGFE